MWLENDFLLKFQPLEVSKVTVYKDFIDRGSTKQTAGFFSLFEIEITDGDGQGIEITW